MAESKLRQLQGVDIAPISKAKSMLGMLVDKPAPTVLFRQNEPVAAVVSFDDYNVLMALRQLEPERMQRLLARAKKAHSTPLRKMRSLKDLHRARQGRKQSRFPAAGRNAGSKIA